MKLKLKERRIKRTRNYLSRIIGNLLENLPFKNLVLKRGGPYINKRSVILMLRENKIGVITEER